MAGELRGPGWTKPQSQEGLCRVSLSQKMPALHREPSDLKEGSKLAVVARVLSEAIDKCDFAWCPLRAEESGSQTELC